jgi:hypothetical protein
MLGANGFTFGVHGSPEVLKEQTPHCKIRKVGSKLSKRIFRILLLEFVLS